MLTAINLKKFISQNFYTSSITDDECNAIDDFLDYLDSRLSDTTTTPLNSEILNELAKLYEYRWQIVAGKARDYTRDLESENKHWLGLVNQLIEEDLISARPSNNCRWHFINFLMPTVTNYKCAITLEYFCEIPLNQCILSEDKSALIPLSPMFDFFKNNQIFAFVSETGKRSLTSTEMSRFQYAYYIDKNSKKKNYWEKFIDEIYPVLSIKTEPISLLTLEKLRLLIEGSCFKEGFVGEYSNLQNNRARQVYDEFRDYLSELSDDEREQLFSQRIIDFSCAETFGELWQKAVKNKFCITYAALYYMKLYKDYLPHLSFEGEGLKEWYARLGPSEYKQVFIPNFYVSHSDCKFRCKQLLAYILTNPFQTFGRGAEIKLGSFIKVVPETVLLIFKELQFVSIHKNWQLALYTILEKIVKPQVEKGKPFERYQDTHDWLLSLYNGEFWQQEKNINYVEVCHLLQNLCDASFVVNVDQKQKNNYIKELIALASSLQKNPSCITSQKRLMRLCNDIREHLADRLFAPYIGDEDKAQHVIKNVAIENLLTQLACKNVAVRSYFWGETMTTCVDEQSLLKLKTQVLQNKKSDRNVSIEQALLDVFHHISSDGKLKDLYNLKLAKDWLLDLGLNTQPLEFSSPAQEQLVSLEP